MSTPIGGGAMSKDKPVELLVKWASFPGIAASIELGKKGYSLIAIPRVSYPDEWWLVCNSQALAGKIATSLKGAYSSLSDFGIDKPTVVVKAEGEHENDDFNEIGLIAQLMAIGFTNIKETERPWPKPVRK